MQGVKKFVRFIEDFVCEKCGLSVAGTGFTNHCPKCLWSKHVDINPGDRAAGCGGMMEPVRVEVDGEKYIITNRCVVCGHEKRNKAAKDDDFEVLLEITRKGAKAVGKFLKRNPPRSERSAGD